MSFKKSVNKSIINIIIASLLVAITILIHSCTKDEQPDRPNIIWIMAEDIGIDLECYGMKGVETPNLNLLAEEGILYSNCYCTNPICSPNRSAMITGVHQNRINAQHHRSNRDVPLLYPYKPITYYLSKAGYTCLLGHSKVMGKGRKTDCNFESKGIGSWDGESNFGLFDKSEDFTAEDQPFFCQIQLKVTHRGDWWNEVQENSEEPVDPAEIELPPYFADHPVIRKDWARYLDQMEYMDHEIGLLMKELENEGLTKNTVVIFIGDNGRCNIRGKGYLYDPGIHIPLIISCPDKLKQGQTDNRLVSTIDISASILHLAGIELPSYMKSIPFIGIKNPQKRDFVYSARDIWDEIYEQSRSITNLNYRYIRNYVTDQSYDAGQAYLEFFRPAVHVMRQLKDEGKLTELQERFFAPEKQAEELYDLVNDPYETRNLVNDTEYQEVLEEMTEMMKQWQNENHDYGLDTIDWDHIVHPRSEEVLEWIKKEKPDLYQQMNKGIEIGFQSLIKEYISQTKKE